MRGGIRIAALAALAAVTALVCGCATNETLVYDDASRPLIRVTNRGIMFGEDYVTPQESIDRLHAHGVPKDATIYVLVDEDYTDQKALWTYHHNFLNRNGYSRAQMVHRRRAESGTVDKVPPHLDKKVVPYQDRTRAPAAPGVPPAPAAPRRMK